jgi:hypothetical protein
VTNRSPRLRDALAGLYLLAAPVAAQYGAIGLSGVGAFLFENQILPGAYVPENEDRLGYALAAGDFDGDGKDDLAIGIPNGDVAFGPEVEGSGMVLVFFGRSDDDLVAGAQFAVLTQAYENSPDPAESSDGFGSALASCDFNGDGFDDLAVGVPNEDVALSGGNAEGAVDVFYGSIGGLGGPGTQHLTQNTAGFGTVAEAGDYFGSALACGELVAGGPFADLAVGARGENLGPDAAPFFDAGLVVVARGTSSGLSGAGSMLLHQDIAGIADAVESSDSFGYSVTTLDMNGDAFDDLAIGVLGEDGRGAIQMIFGTATGLATANNYLRTESHFGGNSEIGDMFGAALAAGDFDGDGFDDVAVGVSLEDVETTTDAGQAVVIYGRSAAPFFEFSRTQFWNATGIHFPGASGPGEIFGYSLAAADFDRDGRDDLAIGEPAGFTLVADDGLVNVIMGSASGLTNVRRHGLTAGYNGHPGEPNQASRFYGWALASGDFDGDGHADLAIGIPGEDGPSDTDIGATLVFYGSLFSDNFEVGNAGYWASDAL